MSDGYDYAVGDRFELMMLESAQMRRAGWRVGDVLTIVAMENIAAVTVKNGRTGDTLHGYGPYFRTETGEWRRLPREAASVEERRAELDTLENLAPFMEPQLLADLRAKVVRNYEADRTSTAEWEAKRTKPLAGKPDPTPTGLMSGGDSVSEALKKLWYTRSEAPTLDWRGYIGMDWGVGCEPQPATPSRGLPFKRHSACPDPHERPVLCETCEALIAVDTTMRDGSIATRWPPKLPQPPEPHRPSDTGMGSVVGPVLSRLR